VRCSLGRIGVWTALLQKPAVARQVRGLEIIKENSEKSVFLPSALRPRGQQTHTSHGTQRRRTGVDVDHIEEADIAHCSMLSKVIRNMPNLIKFHWGISTVVPQEDVWQALRGRARLQGLELVRNCADEMFEWEDGENASSVCDFCCESLGCTNSVRTALGPLHYAQTNIL
jgi:hypothetical protein